MAADHRVSKRRIYVHKYRVLLVFGVSKQEGFPGDRTLRRGLPRPSGSRGNCAAHSWPWTPFSFPLCGIYYGIKAARVSNQMSGRRFLAPCVPPRIVPRIVFHPTIARLARRMRFYGYVRTSTGCSNVTLFEEDLTSDDLRGGGRKREGERCKEVWICVESY